LFTLLTLRFDYPFPLDLPTLAHLYRSSRAFAHFAPDERRCRVAAYAWATGLPVVGTAAVGSLLPETLRKPPVFREVRDPADYAEQIAASLEALGDPAEHGAAADYFAPARVVHALREQLDEQFPEEGLRDEAGYLVSDLGIRLGRHHGISSGPNRVPMTVPELVAALASNELVPSVPDPEVELASRSAAVLGDPAAPVRRSRLRVPWRR